MNFMNDQTCRWLSQIHGNLTLSFKGDSLFAQKIKERVELSQKDQLEDCLRNTFDEIDVFTSGVLESDQYIIAWVDHIRSWPLFYTVLDSGPIISNNARQLLDRRETSTVDPKSCVEFSMSGYVSGKRTLYKEIMCLQPGEFLFYDKQDKNLKLNRYFQYIPCAKKESWNKNIKELGAILDASILKIIKRANGRPIWIPLSGGLDSRIILCKLHEHGYKNLHTFTYGPRFNFESKIAKKLAKNLNVPWIFVSPSKKVLRKYFESVERKSFWYSTDGLKAISSMREFAALMFLRDKKLIPDDAIIINGQSGDYITGGHVSDLWFSERKFKDKDLFKTLFEKHYDLWKELKTERNFDVLKERVVELLPLNWRKTKSEEGGASLEEAWEYDGRQTCLVANGQKSYDFFGYDWEMPLWDKALVDFCSELPLEQKRKQKLYKVYLKEYNYKELFPEKEPYIWRWPLLMLWVIPAAQIIGMIGGNKRKQNFYALMRYHGHYSNQFYSFPWSIHRDTFLSARNVMSLNVRQWAIENPNVIPEDILRGLMIKDVG